MSSSGQGLTAGKAPLGIKVFTHMLLVALQSLSADARKNIYIYIAFTANPKLDLCEIPYLPLPHLPEGALLSLLNTHLPESRAGQKWCGSPTPFPPPHLLAPAQ